MKKRLEALFQGVDFHHFQMQPPASLLEQTQRRVKLLFHLGQASTAAEKFKLKAESVTKISSTRNIILHSKFLNFITSPSFPRDTMKMEPGICCFSYCNDNALFLLSSPFRAGAKYHTYLVSYIRLFV